MTIAFSILSCLMAAAMIIGVIFVKKYNHPARRAVQYLFVAAVGSILCNAFAVLADNEWVSALFQGMYLTSNLWLVVMLLNYVYDCACHYAGVNKLKKSGWWILFVLCATDTVSMVVNTWTRHVFSCREVFLADGSSYFENVATIPEYGVPFYIIHLLLVYGMISMTLFVLVKNMLYTMRLYRGKYEGIILCLVLALIANIDYRTLELAINFMPLVYAVMAFACAYFTFGSVQKGIVVKLLSLSVEDMKNGILCFDKDGNCVYANETGRRIFHAEGSTSPIEQYFKEWRKDKAEESLREESWQEEYEMDGEPHYFEVNFKLLLDDRGKNIGSFFSFTDQTENILELEMQRYSASHDSLTDIYNRERFFERVEETLRAHPEEKRVMIGIDVKDFKLVNDLFGEETGNQILKRIAGLMRRDASPDTLYARLEADHFAMCMREENFIEEDYVLYLEELKRIVHSSIYRMHAHVGVYHIIDPEMSISVMCDKAFVAIGRIKDDYQQIVAHYTENMGSSEQREKVMIGEFDRALQAGEFQMFLQPQVAVDGYGILGAEALVRWDHPVRGMISPAEFIPVFEKSGYITRLDSYMWELACKQLRIWKDQGFGHIHISVNISPKDFYLINIYDTLTALVERYEIDPANLKLEITETALMEEISKHISLLERLRSYGFQVEIDDFGSGYSSLNTLQDIEADVLKLDMGFLRKTSHEKRSRTIMNSVIDMSKHLGLTVVTEGVETIEQVNYLTEAGCDIFQGYYFAKPMPVVDFEKNYLPSMVEG